MTPDVLEYAPLFISVAVAAFVATAQVRAREAARVPDEAERRARRAIEAGDQWEQMQTRIDYAVAAVQRHDADHARHQESIDKLHASHSTLRRQFRASLAVESTGEFERTDGTEPGNNHPRRK